MNGFCGIWRRDHVPIDRQSLIDCFFQSPQWEPDHQAVLTEEKIGFTSTQRFITPEDSQGPMPYKHPSGCVIVADSFLMYRETLAKELNLSARMSDRDLILFAYLKWGTDCMTHLKGDFAFGVWDPRVQRFFCATDPFGTRPFFYSEQDGRRFIFANTMAPFRVMRQDLSVNENIMLRYTLDARSGEETCYREVFKIPAAHWFSVTESGVQKQKYWELKEQKRKLTYRKREDFYEAFREIFASSVKENSNTNYPLMAHISGGLDSSSVASMAAKQAAEKNHILYGFTAIPKELDGRSYRSRWKYHEMPRVRALLAQYSNVEHVAFRTNPLTDPFQDLSVLYPWTDQSFRNVNNSHWILASLRQTSALGGRILLTGERGNATISWAGQSLRDKLSAVYLGFKVWGRPEKLLNRYYYHRNPSFIQGLAARHILRQRGIILDRQDWMLSLRHTYGIYGSIRPMSLWHGVEMLDPTADLKLVEFCYNIPQWVYFRSRETLARRLLVREGLEGIVPEAIRQNADRGEQAADWYLQYNEHRLKWREKIMQISPHAASRLWQWYDKDSMLGLFEKYSMIREPNRENVLDLELNLTRFLSLAFYLDYLDSQGK